MNHKSKELEESSMEDQDRAEFERWLLSCIRDGNWTETLEAKMQKTWKHACDYKIMTEADYYLPVIQGLQETIKIKEEALFEENKKSFREGLRVTHLLQCLKGLQWSGADEHHNPMCPVCGEGFWNHNGKLLKERNDYPNHKENCWLGHEILK